MRTIYLDYNATTPLDPAVLEAMLPLLGGVYGNPSSVHHVGRQARAILDDARERVANVFQCKPAEVVFTSGGTESNNLAIIGTARKLRQKGKHLITSAVEHHAVLDCFRYLEKSEGFTVTVLPVNREGRVSVESLAESLRPDTTLVSVMAANNEIGTIQPVSELGAFCRERGIAFHTDAAQWFGKEPFESIHQFNADLVSLCAHKFHGPKGAGALFIRSPLKPDSITFGGGQENERRAGTENLASIAGLAEAVERFIRNPIFGRDRLQPLSDILLGALVSCPGVHLLGPRQGRLANTVAFAVEGADSVGLLAGLDLEGICASSGSACSAGSLEPSHVVASLGVENSLARSLVRFSTGRSTTLEELDAVKGTLPRVIERAQLHRKPLNGL